MTSIDLSALPPPDLVEQLDTTRLFQLIRGELVTRWPAAAALLASDPATKVLELVTLREALLRQRVNEAVRGVMLASATGTTLDNLAAFVDLKRKVLHPGQPDAVPPVPPTMESHASLRARIQAAWEGLTNAGTIGAYRHHAMAADGQVADIEVTSPAPGEVHVYVLAAGGDGVPSAATLAAVQTALSAEDVRPLTDKVTVLPGTPVDYTVSATLDLLPGPDSSVVSAAAAAAVQAYTTKQRAFGAGVGVDGLYAALRTEGVRRVTLHSPTAPIDPPPGSYGRCLSIQVVTA